MSISRKLSAIYGRNFIFGAEDGIVSTVGLLSGIAVANVDRSTIFLTGTVLIFVEAFSMSIGSFISEDETEEYIERKKVKPTHSIFAAIIMFFSYFIAGLIPLLPYTIFASSTSVISIVASLIALFMLGAISAKLYKINVVKHALQMLLMGAAAIAVGIAVGKLVNR